MSPRPPPCMPPAPSPATRMREPVSTPAGIFTSRLRRLLAHPVPRHSGQGFRLMCPDPPQAGHGSSHPRHHRRVTPPQAPTPRRLAAAPHPPAALPPNARPAAPHEIAEVDVLRLAEAARSPSTGQISKDRAEEVREALAALLEANLGPSKG